MFCPLINEIKQKRMFLIWLTKLNTDVLWMSTEKDTSLHWFIVMQNSLLLTFSGFQFNRLLAFLSSFHSRPIYSGRYIAG
jgi:hypothetical protein